jgi:hypothetical protein
VVSGALPSSHSCRGTSLIENLSFVCALQVENATYMWLPLLPRSDGLGYELHYENKWRPADYRDRARVAVVYNNGTAPPPAAATETAGAGGARVQGGGAVSSAGSEPTGAAAKRTPVTPPAGIEEFTRPSTSALAALSSTQASSTAAPRVTAAASPRPADSFVRRAAGRVEAWLTG